MIPTAIVDSDRDSRR